MGGEERRWDGVTVALISHTTTSRYKESGRSRDSFGNL